MNEIKLRSNIKNLSLTDSLKCQNNEIILPQDFINSILCKAPAEAVKVFLAVLSYKETKSDVLAHKINTTEDVISKAISYWKNRGVIAINPHNGDIEINFTNNTSNKEGKCHIVAYAEEYIGRELNLNELQTILYISKDLNFTDEMLFYLIRYSADRNSFNPGYLRTVALAWDEKGIKTEAQAKETPCKYSKEVYEYLNLLGRRDNIAPVEKETVNKWITEYSIPQKLILDAIDKTIRSGAQGRIMYADRILTDYYNANTTGIKQEKTHKRSKNKIHFDLERDYDYDEIERTLVNKNRIRKEVSQNRAIGQ